MNAQKRILDALAQDNFLGIRDEITARLLFEAVEHINNVVEGLEEQVLTHTRKTILSMLTFEVTK